MQCKILREPGGVLPDRRTVLVIALRSYWQPATICWDTTREPISIATNTYRMRKVAVTETKKSQATIACAWLRTKVDQRWLPRPPCGRSTSRYLRTVRRETRIPSFNASSLAICSSPHVGFSRPICRINSRRFFGSGGRPGRRDFQRQNARKPARCHLMKVSGLTITSAPRQSKSLPRPTITKRKAGVVRLGLTSRSWNNASCFRRNRFSATRPIRE